MMDKPIIVEKQDHLTIIRINRPDTRSKRVLVAGGGPSAIEAARVAHQQGHKVTLCEQNPRLGGRASSGLGDQPPPGAVSEVDDPGDGETPH